jgi:protein tyrosine phosphatase (PTP) superfamily phosphohydrolase (DUF442 family)
LDVTTNQAARQPPSRLNRVVRATAIWAALVALVVFYKPLFTGNFGVVDPGQVYRCAQPKGGLSRLLDQNHPGSILNLRGGSLSDSWYAAEWKAAQERGIEFYDLPLSAVRRPKRRDLLLLLDVMDHCRYPLLIHCKSGADRTGLASALYLMAKRGEPPDQALRAFSYAHGHFPIGGPEHLQEPLREYEAWLEAHHQAHTPDRLRQWVEHDYRASDPAPERLTIRPGPRDRATAARTK